MASASVGWRLPLWPPNHWECGGSVEGMWLGLPRIYRQAPLPQPLWGGAPSKQIGEVGAWTFEKHFKTSKEL